MVDHSPKPSRSAYGTIVFDCINTLLLPDPERFPKLTLDGQEVISTAPLLLHALAPHLPGLEVAVLHRAMRQAWRWAESQRGLELCEVPAPLRFRRLLSELGLEHLGDEFAATLLSAHMASVTGCYRLPPAHKTLLARLKGDYALALFSNFDHGASLRAKLVEEGLADCFDPLIISDGLGYRKPGPAAFSKALALLNSPREAVLMVGDSLEDDVGGAHQAGVDVVWFNPKGRARPAESHLPDYEVASLGELIDLLEI